jgi:hypothetical protein
VKIGSVLIEKDIDFEADFLEDNGLGEVFEFFYFLLQAVVLGHGCLVLHNFAYVLFRLSRQQSFLVLVYRTYHSGMFDFLQLLDDLDDQVGQVLDFFQVFFG